MICLSIVLVLGILAKGIIADTVVFNEKNETKLGRILYGHQTDISQVPYFAGLRHCGGVILNEKWVLTTARCVVKYTEKGHRRHKRPVWVGGNTKHQSKKYHYKHIHIHPGYDGTYNDLALLKLYKNSTFEFNQNVRPVRLNQEQFCGDYATFVGKGTDETGHTWNYLKYINMYAYGTSYGDIFYAVRYDSYTTNYATGICHGDFGGPLVDQYYRLIGIAKINSNINDCYTNQYTYFVDVSHHVGWIYSVIDRHSNDD